MLRDQISEVKVSPVMNGEEEIDDLLWQASQDYEQSLQASQECQQSQSPVSLHFASPLSSEELLSKVEESVPENTRANTKWAVTTWQEWVAERSRVTPDDIPVSLTDATNQQLSYWLPLFVTEARKRDGKRYPGRTLYNLCAALQRSVREYRLTKSCEPLDIFSDFLIFFVKF